MPMITPGFTRHLTFYQQLLGCIRGPGRLGKNAMNLCGRNASPTYREYLDGQIGCIREAMHPTGLTRPGARSWVVESYAGLRVEPCAIQSKGQIVFYSHPYLLSRQVVAVHLNFYAPAFNP
jgi:hypothetical protein